MWRIIVPGHAGHSPTMPSTAYGYIQQGAGVDGGYKYPVYTVKTFKEKPSEETARQLSLGRSLLEQRYVYLAGGCDPGDSKTNAGLDGCARSDRGGLGHIKTVGNPGEIWKDVKIETVDYGIMGKEEKVAVLPAGGLGWSDVGSWSSLFEVLLPDMSGNIATNAVSHLALETNNTLVYGGSDRLVVTIGVDDMVVVDTGDALLICKWTQSRRSRMWLSI